MTEAGSGVDCEKCRCRNGIAQRPWRIPDIGFESRTCPKQLVTAESWYLLQLHAYYEQGHLPEAGGVADQPCKVLQAFTIIASRRAQNAERSRGKKTAR